MEPHRTSSSPHALGEAQLGSLIRTAAVVAAVLLVDFFLLPAVWWASNPQGAPIWKSHAMPAVTLAAKADLHGLWLVPLCALAVAVAAFADLKHIKRSAVLMGAAAVCGLALLYLFGVMSSEGRERLQFLGVPITSLELAGWLLLPLACAGGFLYVGWRLRRRGS